MRILEPHRDAGAYALGVLGAADAFRFEEHLAQCPECGLRVREFGVVAAQLGTYARLTPSGVGPVVEPGTELLHRLVGTVATRRRVSRRRQWALVAAAVVLAVGGPLAVGGRSGGSPGDGSPGGTQGQVRAERWAGTDRVSGASAVVTTGAKDWGTDVGIRVARVPVAGMCALVAVGRDGTEETVSTWSEAGSGEEPVAVRGGAALRPADIDHFEVRAADGRRLVTVTR